MDLKCILSQMEMDNEEETSRLLQQYNRENNRTFTFEQKEEENRVRLCQSLLRVLGTAVGRACQRTCLETLRILSRDRRVLGPVGTREGCCCWRGWRACPPPTGRRGRTCGWRGALRQAEGRPRPHEVRLFSLRLLFLLSALRTDVRASLRDELRALGLLTQVLERTLDVRWAGPYEAAAPDPQAPPIPAEASERAMEALKALFNLTLSDTTVEDGAHQLRLISAIMRHLLLLRAQTEEKTEEAHSHAVNLLSNLPVSCLDVLIDTPVRGGLPEYGGRNMEVVQVLLDFMEKRIDKQATNYKEGLTPVLTLLTEGSRHHRDIRRYIKAQVLPPLKDVTNRPEVGTTVRNKLVRLMTHVDMGVKQSAAEFLFVLCKESVDNLLKYTGYGNAAGLLVARGLLAGGRGDTEYSEDEDSDTEEYKEAKPFINPITGHIEEPMPNPMEEMTEEQKEYEAQKLVNMFDKLSRHQFITPMGMKPDGTLAPLQEAVSQCTVESCSSDSD
ncbi:hypothetical protein ANANG_G00314940 [Anguilla anguilla]|uniref:Synembryn n=1 Tax=Anguilla anguilla TaxID=7936 RepID=A0A9D3LIJ1_ANGAN|nr:hypothetical protein ANANG_G00314940 [Anguilla anguilla]